MQIRPKDTMLFTYIPITILCVFCMILNGLVGLIFLLLMIASIPLYNKYIYTPLCEAEQKDKELYKLSEQLIDNETAIRILRSDLAYSVEKYRQQSNEIARLKQMVYSANPNPSYSEDIKEAIKYARNKSHPDNGGNQADFIKFNELYKRMK